MAGAFYVEPQRPFHSAAGAAFATFTTFQDISPQKPMIPAEMLDLAGTKVEIEAWGEFSTTATPTLSLGVFLGTASTVWAMAALTTGTATAWPWHLRWQGFVTTQGTAGAMFGEGIVDIGTSLTAFAAGQAIPATAAARTVSSIDLTAQKYAGVGAAWSASSASNTIKTNLLTVLLIN